MKIAQNIADLVGNTPLIQLNNINSNILAKCEFMNPSSSIKDRASLYMLQDAIDRGVLDKNTTIIEPTSGNTGIALASLTASLGYSLVLTMPESMSIERRAILKALGANLILTPKELGMDGAIQKAEELLNSIDNSIMLNQFRNYGNVKAHEMTTAVEILKDCDCDVDIFVASVGTGGTLSGTAKALKQKLPHIKIVAVEPQNSALISGKKAGLHKIQGIGAGFIPKILDTDIIDEIITISDNEAYSGSKELALKEGLLVGISAGANLVASQLISQKYPNKKIVTILPDSGERYISTELFG
jgi:cysteine synthase A